MYPSANFLRNVLAFSIGFVMAILLGLGLGVFWPS